MVSNRLLATLISGTLALSGAAVPGEASAALPRVATGTFGVAQATSRTSVLGLRSDDSKAGRALTRALRKTFAKQEMGGGEDLSLEEVILTLDCRSEDDTQCMTEAGESLAMERLVYGSLTTSPDGYTLEVRVLDVTTGEIETQGSLELPPEAIAATNVATTANEIFDELYPSADEPVPAAAPRVNDNDGLAVATDPPEVEKGQLVWGAYQPRPTWKRVGLGVSAGLLSAGVVTAVVAGSLGEYKYEADATRLQEESLTDDDPTNDISGGSNFCDEALESLGTDSSGASVVRNEGVAFACDRGQTAFLIQWVGVGVAIAGGLATIAFATLYNVHRDGPQGTTARRRRGFRLTGGPTRGGMIVGGAGRF